MAVEVGDPKLARFRRWPGGEQSALGCELAHPVPVVAIALLIVNEHVLKAAPGLSGWLTGKLSDFAGLFFFPILLFVLLDGALRAIRGAASRRVLATVAVVATVTVFGLLKLSPGANGLANALFGTDEGHLYFGVIMKGGSLFIWSR